MSCDVLMEWEYLGYKFFSKYTKLPILTLTVNWPRQSSFFQNEEIFIQLDELGKLDRISQAWKWLNYSFTQA